MVVLGTPTMPIHQVMRLSRGAIIELDTTEADEVKVLANNLPIASGVVLVDRNRIAGDVKRGFEGRTGLVRPRSICYIGAVDPARRAAGTPLRSWRNW